MKTLFIVSSMALAGLFANASAVAQNGHAGVICNPKTSTDAGKIRYSGNMILNTSTTSSAQVLCTMGQSTGPGLTVRDANAAGGQNVSCTGYYYVTGILSNAGTQTSSGTGFAFFGWSSVGIMEYWTTQCTLPPATGAAESQMSSVDAVF